jgi:dTDP-4-amino-4,6-dideoxygalactose transaminase
MMNVSKNPLIRLNLIGLGAKNFEFSGNLVPASLGRYAIYRILEMLRIGSDEEILVPSYHCLAMIEPIRRYGCGLRFYRVRMGLQTHLEDITKALGPRTRAVLLVHYFGMFQKETAAIKKFLEEHHIFLVEDCAHVIPRWQEPTGGIGDISVYSPRKYLASMDGAIIRINNPRFVNRIRNSRLPLLLEAKNMKNLLEEYLLHGRNRLLRELYLKVERRVNSTLRQAVGKKTSEGEGSGSVEFRHGFIHLKCSSWAQYLMKRTDFEGIYEKRVLIFDRLYEAFYARNHLEPLEFIADGRGKCVFGFPVLSCRRGRVIGALKEKNIETFTFGDPLYQGGSLGENSDEMRLSTDMFFVPIHQDLKEDQISYLANSLTEVMGR